uniref:BMERB domain-containing protein n=1 Tax=Oreochromis niloticus TaxID=8128 RepID=A0A669DIX5_ORENI
MPLVHPGPWTQLPPAPAPLPTFRSKSASNLEGSSNRSKVPASNPFEDEEEDNSQREAAKTESEDQNKPLLGATQSEGRTLASQEAEEKTDLSPCRGPAPGHGFPLIKRKVQTDQCTSPEELQVQMREVDQHLETLEGKGVELERNLRGCKNDKQEEQMLMQWFSLIHERHVLMCHDTELVHLTKQKNLEDRQTDVEYELRCLFNKPDKNWSQEDRDKEKKLMDELVTIIEQRNHIISSLDQDRQRYLRKKINYAFKEGLKELTKSKKDFKPTKVLKILNHKEESTKNSVDKKS